MSLADTTERKPRKTKFVPDAPRDLAREMEASKVLLSSLREIAAGDEDFLSDLVEGETDLLHIIAKIDASELEDQGVVAGCDEMLAKLGERKKKAKARIELKRTMITVALEQIGLKSHKTPLGTYSISYPQPVAEVTCEADIPARFWAKGDPTLLKKALNEAVQAHADALAAAEAIEDEGERETALALAQAEHPEIPGAALAAPSAKLTIRR